MNKADLLKKLESIKAGIDNAPAQAKPLMQKAIDNIESQIAELDKEGNVKPEAKAEPKTEGRAKAGRPKGTTKPKAEKEKRGRGRPAKKVVEKAPEEKPVTEVQINKVAKDIREEGEPMIRARKRAKKALTEIKEVAKETKQMESKGTLTKSKILAEIKKLNKVFANLGVDIVVESADDLFRDATRTALPKGRRVSKNGKEYYESRPNRSDSLQGTAIYPKLKLAEGGSVKKNYPLPASEVQKIKELEDYLEKTYDIDIYAVGSNKAREKYMVIGGKIIFSSDNLSPLIFEGSRTASEYSYFPLLFLRIQKDIKEKFGFDSQVNSRRIAIMIDDSVRKDVDEMSKLKVGDMVRIDPNYESIYSYKNAEVVRVMPDNKTYEVKIKNKNGNEYVKFERDELFKFGDKLSESVKRGIERKFAEGGMIQKGDKVRVLVGSFKGRLAVVETIVNVDNEDFYLLKFTYRDGRKDFFVYPKESVKKYAKGGMVDLFEDYENIPEKVAVILDSYKDEFGEDMDYQDTQNMLNEIEAVGYTFDYYLDNVPYGLRPIGTPLSALQGYEDEEDVDYDDYEDYDDEDGDGSEREYLVVCQDRESGEQQEFEVYAEDEEEAREMALSDCDFKNPKIISVERYAKGGEMDERDSMSYARTKGKEGIDWDKELRKYAGSNYSKLSEREKEQIISDMQKDFDRGHSFAKGGRTYAMPEEKIIS